MFIDLAPSMRKATWFVVHRFSRPVSERSLGVEETRVKGPPVAVGGTNAAEQIRLTRVPVGSIAHQDRRGFDLRGLDVRERLVGVLEAVAGDARADGDGRGLGQERLAVRTGVGGHAPESLFPEEVRLVGQGG